MLIQEAARDLFGIRAEAQPLAGEFDDNFRLTAADGSQYILKIMRPGCDPAFIDLQCRALERLAGFPVPRPAAPVQTTEDGRLAWLLHCLPGRMLAEISRTPEMLLNLGRLLGQIDCALADFSHPFAHRELKWDLSRAAWIEDHLDCIANPKRRAIVQRIVEQFKNAHPFRDVRRSILHGDANLHNILVEDDRISGLIDFGDLHFGAPVAELAVACAYVSPQETAGIIQGYEETNPLTEPERRVLPLLIQTRLAVSVTNSAWMQTKSADPYVTVSDQDAWKILER
jgi:Ser/Thr protein kinase RdoA (MazF antagonist)